MARRVFYSFHYQPDVVRVSQVRNIGALEDNPPVTDNDWETVAHGGDQAIRRWIDGQLSGRSAAVVLIGAATAGRKWINYEIEQAWNSGKGVVGVHIHRLKNWQGQQSAMGRNPFTHFTMNGGSVAGQTLSNFVKTYDPPYLDSKQVYAHIRSNLEAWVEEAVINRNRHP